MLMLGASFAAEISLSFNCFVFEFQHFESLDEEKCETGEMFDVMDSMYEPIDKYDSENCVLFIVMSSYRKCITFLCIG